MKKLIIAVVLICVLSMCCHSRPFEVRGIKGLWWQGIDKYEKVLPWLAEHKLNFLMLCYSSFPASGMDWRAGYTPEEKEQFRKLAARGKELGVDVCLSFNPGIWSKPPLVYSSDADFQIAFEKIKMAHGLGINWIGLCLDDINRSLDPADQARFGNLQGAQVYFVNRLWSAMKTLNPRPKLIFCPSAYLTADMNAHLDYIRTIGDKIDPDVMMFWTGPECCSPSITGADARQVAKLIKRKPFVWDNYPVNDMFPWRPLMSPLKNRSADLGEEVSGYISNPMKQLYMSEIVLATTAAYLNDPAHYDPARAMEAAVNAYPEKDRDAVRLLVELYGSSFWGEKGFPPHPELASAENAPKALQRLRALRHKLSANADLTGLWEDVQPTLEQDIAMLDQLTRKRDNPLFVDGMDFRGGAGEVYGYIKENRRVNYVYAKPTGKNEMTAEYSLKQVPNGARLRVLGRNSDTGDRTSISIWLNGQQIIAPQVMFSNTMFEEKVFGIPQGVLKPGTNTLTIRNESEQGMMGMPPWFMVAEAEIVPG